MDTTQSTMPTMPEAYEMLPLLLLIRFHEAHTETFANSYFQLRNRLKEEEAPAKIKTEFDEVVNKEHHAITTELRGMCDDIEQVKQRLYPSFPSFVNEDIISTLAKAQTIIRVSLAEKQKEFLGGGNA